MNAETTDFDGVLVFTLKDFPDERGSFMEAYRQERYPDLPTFVQDNVSYSEKNVVRGLHYQVAPYEQGKLVCVLKGEVLDVVVDVRKESQTYGKHVKVVLSRENKKQLWIPPGFAHGFVANTDAIVYYKCTAKYDPESERSILWNDPTLAIDWGVEHPIVSERDRKNPRFS